MPIWRQLLRVTLYLHRNGIVYRDLHPSNIYINEKGIILTSLRQGQAHESQIRLSNG